MRRVDILPAQAPRISELVLGPGNATGATLSRAGQVGRFGHPEVEDVAARRRELPGPEPFIVPPLATKSEYYRNPITREIWRAATEALAGADHII